MRLRQRLAIFALTLLAGWQIGHARSCEAYYPFDGNLKDASGNGFHGTMIGADRSARAQPMFVEGRNGGALRFDGSSVMRALLDLHPDSCPQITISAWIKVLDPGAKGARMVVSTGKTRSPGLKVNRHILTLNGPVSGLRQSDVFRDGGEWVPVTGVYNFRAGTYTLHWRGRSKQSELNDRWAEPEDALWVGAMNDRLAYPAKGIFIDDLRITGRALTVDQVNELRAAGPGESTPAAASPVSTETESETADSTSVVAGAVCSTQRECKAGTYCAVDGTCHPEDHLPRPVTSDSGRTLEDMQTATADQYGDIAGDVESDAIPDLTPADSGRTLEDMQNTMADQYGDIGGDVESDLLRLPAGEQRSGNESTNGESDGSSESTDGVGGTPDGKGSTGLGDYLSQISMPTATSGDTRECKSPVQRLSDLATGFRDALVEIAHSVACGMAERPIASLAVAAGVEDPSVYETREFQSNVVNELIETCRTATPDIVYLPDAMLNFWNEQIANNNWSTIGPRSLVFGSPESGNIISPGDRMFISTSPWIDNVDPHVTIEEFSGRSRMQVTICVTNALTGHSAVMRRFVINDTRAERRDEKETFLHIIPAELSYITVFLDGRSTPDRHFRYKLIVDK